jgi:acetylornithine/N-succinyldiaminopimelate aminotransferase
VVAGMTKAFFCNSGAEAVEAAIKLARLYGHQRHNALPAIIVTENSFHGRTLATLSATGNRKVQAGFEPLVQGFIRVPYNDVEALHAVARNSPQVVAVLIEPIQGEGGINIPGEDYLKSVRELCDRHGWLMMLDEIQTGMGRTGRWFGYQHYDLYPDVIAVAKGLANGVPIGACLARGTAAEVYQPGNHGSTFGGNPLACSAGLAVLAAIKAAGLVERAAILGQRLLAGLREALASCEIVAQIRGRGLMIGIELTRPSTHLPAAGLAKGILFSIQSEKVIRLLPPLIISDTEADEIVDRISGLVREDAARSN